MINRAGGDPRPFFAVADSHGLDRQRPGHRHITALRPGAGVRKNYDSNQILLTRH